MVAYCPNVIGGVKAVALGNGAGAGMGYGAGYGYGAGAGAGCGTGMGFHALAGGCKTACCGLFGAGFFPLAMVAAVGFLGYKVYSISKNDAAVVKTAD